jgi:hypothetical protein
MATTRPAHLYGGETSVARLFRDHPENMLALSRYEATLDRALGRAYAMLERRQAARRGEPVPAPVTVLVEGVDSIPANPLDRHEKNENYETKPTPIAEPG